MKSIVSLVFCKLSCKDDAKITHQPFCLYQSHIFKVVRVFDWIIMQIVARQVAQRILHCASNTCFNKNVVRLGDCKLVL